MTQKEILYLEDLLSAEQLAEKTTETFMNQITDSDLKQMVTTINQFHKQNIQKLNSLV